MISEIKFAKDALKGTENIEFVGRLVILASFGKLLLTPSQIEEAQLVGASNGPTTVCAHSAG